jgi:Serine dehydrogenase proteinase
MRRWQVWFFGRSGQVLFWLVVVLVGWVLVGYATHRPRWWWPFERSSPAVVIAPANSVPGSGWTAVAKPAMPAVVNVASAKAVRGPEGLSSPFFSDPFFRFFGGPQPGGLVLAAGQIAHALRRHRAKVTVFVPHYAMSGGTLIALAADEIVMDPNAVLGPVDPQLGDSPAASVLSVLDRKKFEDIDDETFIKADVSRKAIAQVRRTAQDLLSERMPSEQAATLADKLATGTWTHDYPIMAEEAKELGLPVSTEMPEEVYQFMSLFPQPTRTRSAVEYVPAPYRGHPGGRGSREG